MIVEFVIRARVTVDAETNEEVDAALEERVGEVADEWTVVARFES